MLKPTVFIDRDGTINIDGGYINHPDNFIVYPFAAQAIRMLNQAGWLVVIVTNQSGIGRGFYNEAMMHRIHDKMKLELTLQGAYIDKIYYCPHDKNSLIDAYKSDCDCRKPKPGLLLQAIEELSVDKSNMYMIGDKYSDLQAGFAIGCKGILVKTGYGKGDLENKSSTWKVSPDYVVENLLEAVTVIVNK